MTKNKIFYLAWQIFQDIFIKAYHPILEKIFPEGASKPIEANKRLLKAIKSKDPDTINKALEFHAKEEYFHIQAQTG